MHYEFTINEIKLDLRTKTISVDFAFDIDPDTITTESIQIRNRANGNYEEYDYKIDGHTLYITLVNWPEPNQDYILRIEGLQSILGDQLTNAIRKKIVFNSAICSTITIISPSLNELINDNINIKWEENIADTTHKAINSYYLEISDDAHFHNIVLETTIKEKKNITLDLLDSGQYFLRIRAQKDEDYGLWSEPITFLTERQSNINSKPNDNEPIFIRPMSLISQPKNGETPTSFMFEFDCAIDSDFLDNIVVIRKEI